MAAKTTEKDSSEVITLACRAICAASSLCDIPEPEKIGSFCPLTRVFIPSIVEMPVWINSLGYALAVGLIGDPVMGSLVSEMISGPPSSGLPRPSKNLPTISLDTARRMISPVKRTLVSEVSIPLVPSNTWTTAISLLDSRTCPRRFSPSGVLILTTSPKATPSRPSATRMGQATSLTVLYSFVLISIAMVTPSVNQIACLLYFLILHASVWNVHPVHISSGLFHL